MFRHLMHCPVTPSHHCPVSNLSTHGKKTHNFDCCPTLCVCSPFCWHTAVWRSYRGYLSLWSNYFSPSFSLHRLLHYHLLHLGPTHFMFHTTLAHPHNNSTCENIMACTGRLIKSSGQSDSVSGCVIYTLCEWQLCASPLPMAILLTRVVSVHVCVRVRVRACACACVVNPTACIHKPSHQGRSMIWEPVSLCVIFVSTQTHTHTHTHTHWIATGWNRSDDKISSNCPTTKKLPLRQQKHCDTHTHALALFIRARPIDHPSLVAWVTPLLFRACSTSLQRSCV